MRVGLLPEVIVLPGVVESEVVGVIPGVRVIPGVTELTGVLVSTGVFEEHPT